MDQLKTIIVDDSKNIRTELKFLLSEFSELLVTGEAANVTQAIRLIEQQKPDVIFLDIQLQNETGFDLLEKTDVTAQIIFITAHDKYAIRAFEVNAIDYLLKPIKKDRLKKAIDRLIPENKNGDEPHNKVTYDDVVYLMINRSLKFIKVASIKSIVAEGKYSFLQHNEKRKNLASKTLLEWEEILPEKYFVRIHRSTIINFEHVDKVRKCPNNTHEVFVKGVEEPFIMSRRYAAKLKTMLSL
ncbi:MAG: LytTR family DNA-binding domain-containing protein [Melioribacteraceae bacterium]|nr:LytTR family DNA-binding domain-containing protein [Melioribacteraceae bacterium]